MTDTQTAPAALAVRESGQVAAWTPSFAVSVAEAVAQVEAKHDFFKKVMRLGDHYAPPVGVTAKPGDPPPKPVLLKPGAELLLANMGLSKELFDAETPTIDYGEPGREALIRYRKVCRIYRQVGILPEERMLVAQSEGSCSSRETKYRYRTQERACPKCGAHAIKTSKFDDGGYYCYGKIGGCGAKFSLGDAAIESQTTGRVPNPDVADLDNTILKMAEKRALVGATLLATGCSDIFTADIEQEPKANDDDAIDAAFTEYHETRPAAKVTLSGGMIDEILNAAMELGFDTARVAKGVHAMSEDTTETLANLLPEQGAKLLAYLKREIAKKPKPVEEVLYCQACGTQTSPQADAKPHEANCPEDDGVL